MSKAKLSIYVSDLDEPCKISNRTWYITIYHCDGSVLTWCGKRYIALRARCGHLEVSVPPGCYYIKAVWSYWVHPRHGYHGNHFTDAAIVNAQCDATNCVTIFTPRVHRCGYLYRLGVQDLVAQKIVDGAVLEQLTGVVDAVEKKIGRSENDFELAHIEELEDLVRKQEDAGDACDDVG